MYAANIYIKNYLVGKGFNFLSNDYRYYYFEDSTDLQNSIDEIPIWDLISFSNPWGE